MSFDKLMRTMLRDIVKNRGQSRAVIRFQKYINENGWPSAYNRSAACNSIRLLINRELPDDPVQVFSDMLCNIIRKPIELTKSQEKHLRLVIEIINKAKGNKCRHENLGIAPFLHGSVTSPIIAIPELICKNCGLNITLSNRISIADYRKNFGIKTSKEFLDAISRWAKNCQNVHSSGIILRNPIETYNISSQWHGAIDIEITDFTKLASKGGS